MTKLSGTAICAFLLLFMMQANAQDKGKGFVIKGTIKGVNSGVVHMLAEDGHTTVDSAAIVDGQFVMKGKTGVRNNKAFKIMPGNWIFRALVEDTMMTFAIDTTGAMHQYTKGGDMPMIWEIKQTGSKMANVYTRYHEETGWAYGFSLFQKLKLVKNATEAAGIKSQMDSVMKLVPAKQKTWAENYIRQYPASIAGVFIFNELYHSSLSGEPADYLRSVINQFTGEAKATIYYQELIQATTGLGDLTINSLAPDFTLQKRDKTKFTLSTTRGRYTMVDFWASWCVPCRKAIPNWKKIYAKYHLKGLNIVSISDDRNWKDWLPALDQEKMPWIQVIDEFPSLSSTAKVTNLYRVPSYPFYVLLDKKGKVLLASGDEEAMTRKIAEVLP